MHLCTVIWQKKLANKLTPQKLKTTENIVFYIFFISLKVSTCYTFEINFLSLWIILLT